MKNDGENRPNGSGFIKLSRSLTEWEWYDDPNVLVVWVHCLMSACWKDYRYRGEIIPRGSFITSYAKFAQECGLAVTTVRRCFDKLKSTGEITLQVTHRGTRVNVRRYAVYQSSGGTGWHAGDTTGDTTADTLEKNIRSKEVKKNTKKKFFSRNRSEALPEYYNAEPIRNPNPEPATPEEVEALRKKLQKGKEK